MAFCEFNPERHVQKPGRGWASDREGWSGSRARWGCNAGMDPGRQNMPIKAVVQWMWTCSGIWIKEHLWFHTLLKSSNIIRTKDHLDKGTWWLVNMSVCICRKSPAEEGGTKVDCDAWEPGNVKEWENLSKLPDCLAMLEMFFSPNISININLLTRS